VVVLDVVGCQRDAGGAGAGAGVVVTVALGWMCGCGGGLGHDGSQHGKAKRNAVMNFMFVFCFVWAILVMLCGGLMFVLQDGVLCCTERLC